MRKSLNQIDTNNAHTFTSNKVLALFVDCSLTKKSSKSLRKLILENGHDIFPSPDRLQQYRKSCSLSKDLTIVKEKQVKVSLQDVVDIPAQSCYTSITNKNSLILPGTINACLVLYQYIFASEANLFS